MEIVDAHQHFWDLDRNYLPWLSDDTPIRFRYGDYSALRRNYSPEDYRADTGRYNVVASVYVEAEFDPENPLGETAWVADVKAQHGLPTVMVGQAWLDRSDAEDVLAAHGRNPLVRGVRHKPAAAPDKDAAERGARGSMDDPTWRRGFAMLAENSLSFDLQTPWWHLDAAHDLAADFPQTQIIINHTGLPSDRSAEALAAWETSLKLVARQPNVALKISGLGLPGRAWTVENNREVVLRAIEAFSPERIMFASNFPVDSLVATFEEIFDGFDQITSGFDDQERAMMFRDNARTIYRMEE